MVDGDQQVQVMDPAAILRDSGACAVLRDLGVRLRSLGYNGSPSSTDPDQETDARVLIALARGAVVRPGEAEHALGPDACAALVRSGVLIIAGNEACFSGKIFPMRSVLTVLPANDDGLDIVYLGQDSVCLFEIVWANGGHGHLAADLGTGNGFIAAALATRFDHVVAADLSPRCCATAALVPVLNPHLRGRYSAATLDIARGLRTRCFDLVAANAPWVPEIAAPDGGPPRRFAAGGPTGFELPRRFLDQACELLAPGGRAFIACTDIEFEDGRRPLEQYLPELASRGVDVTVTPTRMNEVSDFTVWAQEKAPGAIAARHTVVTIRRPTS